MKREQLSTDITRIQFDSMEEWLVNVRASAGSDALCYPWTEPYKTNQELWMEKKGQDVSCGYFGQIICQVWKRCRATA